MVVNRSNSPIFVFDGMLDRPTGTASANWVYADIKGTSAVLKRALEPIRDGAIVEFPHGPAARELGPGTNATGTFRVELPLKQSEPCGSEDRKFKTVEIDKLEVAVGWCLKSAMLEQMSDHKAVKIGDVSYWPFGFYNIQEAQKIAKSAPAAVKLRGRNFMPR